MYAALGDLLAGARRGDVLVFTNSSHGTYRADESGDESLYDEALCPYDCEDELIVDDELRELFVDIPRGVRVTVISDSCHSGSATRDPEDPFAPDRRRRRFCDPRAIGRPDLPDIRQTARPRSAELYPESAMRELLLSGCRSDQYSYDARFGRTFHGAMSIFAQTLIADAGYRITYRQLHRRLVPALRDANYDQEPQLEGRDYVQAPAGVHVTPCVSSDRHGRHVRRRPAGGHAAAPCTSATTGPIDAVQPARRAAAGRVRQRADGSPPAA